MSADAVTMPVEVDHLARLEAAIVDASRPLERFARQRNATLVAPAAPSDGAHARFEDGDSALGLITQWFGLTPFERDVLLLTAATELSAEVAHVCTLCHQDPARPHMTFGLALAALDGASRRSIGPDEALRGFHLVEIEGDSWLYGRLSVPAPVIQFLLGTPVVDSRLSTLLEHVAQPDALLPSQYTLARQMAGVYAADTDPDGVEPLLHLVSSPSRASLDIVAAAAAMRGLNLYRLPEERLPQDAQAQALVLQLWRRDRLFVRGGLAITLDQADGSRAAGEAALARAAGEVEGFTVVIGTGAAELSRRALRPIVRLELTPPDATEMQGAWQALLGSELGAHPLVPSMADQFRLPLPSLQACMQIALAEARDAAGEGDVSADEFMRRLWRACRVQGRERLAGLAQLVPAGAHASDLILPESLKTTLSHIIARHRHRHRVLVDWGFAQAGARGLGLTVMFAGRSGTGKTMAAEVVANELELDLFRIDLSQVVNKYIGETEKNLRHLFDAADETGAVLLFDEADALFGRRTDVKDSHDRHANIEVGYLLQRMETYRGVAILTTNMASALDAAFMRRLAYILHFPFPDPAQRREIWRRVYPADTPVDGLLYDRLAQPALSGGQIRSVALNAAMLAAGDATPVTMAHIASALQTEYQKLQRSPTTSDLAGWGV